MSDISNPLCFVTAWKFTIAPENRPSQKKRSLPAIIFQGQAIKFRGFRAVGFVHPKCHLYHVHRSSNGFKSRPIEYPIWKSSQLMVDWWFGLMVWIPRIPLRKGLLLGGTPNRIPNHQPKPSQTTSSQVVASSRPLKYVSPAQDSL